MPASSKRRLHLTVAVLTATVLVSAFFISQKKKPDSHSDQKLSDTPILSPAAPPIQEPFAKINVSTEEQIDVLSEEEMLPAAAELGQPGQTAEANIKCVLELLHEYDLIIKNSTFPIGTNNEIVASLTGGNRYKQVFLPKNHPSINKEGELVDQWNTPYFFHAIASNIMEIISAGPDKIMYTADDIALSSSH